MTKVGIVALSIDEKVLGRHLMNYLSRIVSKTPAYEYDVRVVVYTQGFDALSLSDEVDLVRDDNVYRKGCTISEIRDYFTQRVLTDYDFDYIMFVDDDLNPGVYFKMSLDYEIDYLEKHPEVGMVSLYTTRDNSKIGDHEDLNPSRVYMGPGILVRRDAITSWGSERGVVYFEECVLSTGAYLKGYDVKKGFTDATTVAPSTGLGKSLEEKWKDNFAEMPGGRQVMCKVGYLTPVTDNTGVNFRKVPRLTPLAKFLHDNKRGWD